jgi:hypothetical protein
MLTIHSRHARLSERDTYPFNISVDGDITLASVDSNEALILLSNQGHNLSDELIYGALSVTTRGVY